MPAGEPQASEDNVPKQLLDPSEGSKGTIWPCLSTGNFLKVVHPNRNDVRQRVLQCIRLFTAQPGTPKHRGPSSWGARCVPKRARCNRPDILTLNRENRGLTASVHYFPGIAKCMALKRISSWRICPRSTCHIGGRTILPTYHTDGNQSLARQDDSGKSHKTRRIFY